MVFWRTTTATPPRAEKKGLRFQLFTIMHSGLANTGIPNRDRCYITAALGCATRFLFIFFIFLTFFFFLFNINFFWLLRTFLTFFPFFSVHSWGGEGRWGRISRMETRVVNANKVNNNMAGVTSWNYGIVLNRYIYGFWAKMEGIYEISSSEKVKSLEEDLKKELKELQNEVEESNILQSGPMRALGWVVYLQLMYSSHFYNDSTQDFTSNLQHTQFSLFLIFLRSML